MAWFENWFDSHYYHLLYEHRNEAEAAAFIDALLAYLKPLEGSTMLDLACGKGRYAHFLAEKGFNVVGLDLSKQSILAARALETDNLSFYTQDMRRPYSAAYFQYVFSFFTSFGYFETEREDQAVFDSVRKNLHLGGIFVLDFMNAAKVIRSLQPSGEKTVRDANTKEKVHFTWQKRVENGFIYKKIELRTAIKHLNFEERVRAFSLTDFKRFCAKSGLEIIETFGDYALAPYDEADSDRLILVMKRIA